MSFCAGLVVGACRGKGFRERVDNKNSSPFRDIQVAPPSLLSVFFNGYTRDACGTKRRGNRVPFACIRCDVRGGGSWRPRSKKQRCARFLRKQRAPLVPTFQRPCDVEYSAPASRFSVSACGGFRAPINHAHATASQGLPSQARYHPPTRVAFTTTQNFCDARASYTARTEASIKRNAVHSSCNTTRVFRVPLCGGLKHRR